MARGGALLDYFDRIFDTSGYPPRWECGNWSQFHGWLHIISDAVIFASYFGIPCVLAWFAMRRRDLPFFPIFWLFGAFIFSCGLGHLIEAIIFWHPIYRVAGVVKVCTAAVSLVTLLALVPIVPRVLDLPGLAATNRDLAAKNDELERFANAMQDREERVIELKLEVNQLLQQLGEEPKYLSGSLHLTETERRGE